MTDVRADSAPTTSDQSRRNPHGDFIWYELITPDPDVAKAFYTAVVGWEVETGKDGYGHLKAGDTFVGGMLRLTDEMRQHGARPTWLGYVGVDDVDESVRSIEQAGGRLLMPAFDIDNVGRIALVADPQGAPFYVMRGSVDEVSTAFSPGTPGHCSWNELAASDPASALDFYTSRFNWERGDSMPMGEKGAYRFINHNGRMIGAVFPLAAGAMPDQPPKWRYYFQVPDADRAKQAIEAGGGTVAMGPHEVPGGERIIIAIDPQGAEFAIVGK